MSGALLFSLALAAMADCPIPEQGAIPGNEAAYYQCAETFATCGPDGYLLAYGSKYALRFYREARPKMSARGKVWIDDVLVCLQRDLREQIDETTSCEAIADTAYASHPGCYLSAGFCSLPTWDLIRVVYTIDAEDWWSTGVAAQALQTALACVLI